MLSVLTLGTKVTLNKPYRSIEHGGYVDYREGVVIETLLGGRYGVRLYNEHGTYGPPGNPATVDFSRRELKPQG